MSNKNSNFFKAFSYAFNGFKFAFQERNFKLHLISTFCVVTLAFISHVSAIEWCILLLCIGAVLSLEIVNSAIESLVDKISPERHPVAGKIKDLAAAAVLCSSIISFIIALIIFIPYWFPN
jgi:diacylglycerol kinase